MAARHDVPYYEARYVSRPDERRPSAHGSVIAELPNGDLLAAWYGGSREYGLDVSIMGARLAKGERAWSDAAVWADVEQRTMGNPVLFVEPGADLTPHPPLQPGWRGGAGGGGEAQRVWLFYVVLHGERWTTGKIHYRHSTDGGASWGPEQTLTEELGYMTRNKLLVLPDGRWLLPLYDERDWSALVYVSADRGASWQRHGDLRAPWGVIQPTVVPLSDGRLLAYMRTGGRGGLIWQATSEDGGYTWSDVTPTPSALPNPNAGCDVVRCRSGALVLAFNNTPSGRSPLNLALSDDDGRTWPRCRALETAGGEYSYPALIQAADGLLHVTYTYRRTHIKHVACNEAWLRAAAAGAP